MLAWKLRAAGQRQAVPYTSAVAAITNKTIYARADTATGANAATLTTTNWDNEAVATPNFTGTATYQTAIQNGFRGILADGSAEDIQTTSTLNTITGGSGLSYTAFAVEKRTGTQGSSTAGNRYLNSGVMCDNGWLGMHFDGSSRRFLLYSFDTVAHFTDTGFDFTDNTPYVLAWKVEADGSVRVNFNGAIFTAGAGSQVDPSTKTGPFRLNKRSAGTDYGFEYIFSSDAIPSDDMDNLVDALKLKWAI